MMGWDHFCDTVPATTQCYDSQVYLQQSKGSPQKGIQGLQNKGTIPAQPTHRPNTVTVKCDCNSWREALKREIQGNPRTTN